jgi:hypothetical protein
MLSIIYTGYYLWECHKWSHNDKCQYVEYRYTECRYAESLRQLTAVSFF